MNAVHNYRAKIAQMQNALKEAEKCAKIAVKQTQGSVEGFATSYHATHGVKCTLKQFIELVWDFHTEAVRVEKILADDTPDPEQLNWFLS